MLTRFKNVCYIPHYVGDNAFSKYGMNAVQTRKKNQNFNNLKLTVPANFES